LRICASTSAKYCCVFSMRVPGGRAHVQAHLAGIDLREEIPAQQRKQQQRTRRSAPKNASTVRRGCDSAQASVLR
jgi:hypothetical protein